MNQTRYALWLRVFQTCCFISASGIAYAPIVLAEDVVPGASWTILTPAEVGLDQAELDAMATLLGGHGCISRNGYLVYGWNSWQSPRGIASAAKPIYTHFLFKAVEDGRLPSVDDALMNQEPCVANINAAQDYPDRALSFRDCVRQTACYGVAESPGEAFDYNDYTMALFWDTLFLNVYGSTYATADDQVLKPLLTDILQFEDAHTFFNFGQSQLQGRVGVSPRDFARFGLLYLRGGRWGGQQIINADTVALLTGTPLPASLPRTNGLPVEMCPNQRTIGGGANQSDHFGSYSYTWWTNGLDAAGNRLWPDAPADSYAAIGLWGADVLLVIPSLDIVLSSNSGSITSLLDLNEAWALLVASVETPEPEAPATVATSSNWGVIIGSLGVLVAATLGLRRRPARDT